MKNYLNKQRKNQKGFTLVEILVVIVIIGILFMVVLPRIDFASDKARTTGVQTDLRQYMTSADTYLKSTAGSGITIGGYNGFLDNAMQFDTSTEIANLEDPWGSAYNIHLVDGATNDYAMIAVFSNGKGEGNLTINGNPADFVMATYYYQGTTASCTDGLGDSNIQLQADFTLDGDCGSPVDV